MSRTRTGAGYRSGPGRPSGTTGRHSNPREDRQVARIGDGGDLLKCSFCGKSQKQVKKLIAGPGVYICDECIDLCNEIIEEELAETSDLGLDELPKPREIFDFLEQYVVGQEPAKKALAVAVYNHYKRIQAGEPARKGDEPIDIAKSNILLIGPTGCGKTYLAQTLARMLNVLEGTTASVPPQGGRKHPHQEFIQIDTTNVLFIVGGAFAGLEKLIEQRAGRKGLGFGAELHTAADASADAYGDVMPEDLMKFGLIPEFIGRLPVITTVSNLDREALVRILTRPRNALVKQYQRMFEIDGVELEFTPDALEAVAEQAILRGTGARGLRAIMEEVLLPVMFDVPSDDGIARVVVNRAVVLDNVNPTIVRRDAPEQQQRKRPPREKSA